MLLMLSMRILHLQQLFAVADAYVYAAAQPRIRRRHQCRRTVVTWRHAELCNTDHLRLVHRKEQELAEQHR